MASPISRYFTRLVSHSVLHNHTHVFIRLHLQTNKKGPGLAIRVIGAISRTSLDILRDADDIMIQEIRAAGVYKGPIPLFPYVMFMIIPFSSFSLLPFSSYLFPSLFFLVITSFFTSYLLFLDLLLHLCP